MSAFCRSSLLVLELVLFGYTLRHKYRVIADSGETRRENRSYAVRLLHYYGIFLAELSLIATIFSTREVKSEGESAMAMRFGAYDAPYGVVSLAMNVVVIRSSTGKQWFRLLWQRHTGVYDGTAFPLYLQVIANRGISPFSAAASA